MDATPATEGSQQGKRVVRVAAKQSGVRGVSWNSGMNCWRVQWYEGGKAKSKSFYVHRYMKSSGKGYQEADAEALCDAIAFHESLVRDGVVKAASASRQAGVKGVYWEKDTWRVAIKVDGRQICGRVRPKDDTPEEIERACLAAVERRRQLELEHFQIEKKEAVDPNEMQKKRGSGVTGVIWDSHGLAWRSSICVKGKAMGKAFRPKDMSDESVEAARLEAVQHRRNLEHRYRDTGKASSSPLREQAVWDLLHKK